MVSSSAHGEEGPFLSSPADDQIVISLRGFQYDGKPLEQAYKNHLEKAKRECKDPSTWIKRIGLYAKISQDQYKSALLKIPAELKDSLHDACRLYQSGKVFSYEAYEVCFQDQLFLLARQASDLSKSGVASLRKIEESSKELAKSLKSVCKDERQECILGALKQEASALAKTAADIKTALGAWAIGSNLRTDCDRAFSGQNKACTSQKSNREWYEFFRPAQDPVPVMQVMAKPSCAPRSDKLEDTIDACLNNGCAQRKDDSMEQFACQVFAQNDLSEYQNPTVTKTMSYLDADSVVFLTRAKLIHQLLESHYQGTGRMLPKDEIPMECRKIKELSAGVGAWKPKALEKPEGLLKEQVPELIRLSKKLVRGYDHLQQRIKEEIKDPSKNSCNQNHGSCTTQFSEETTLTSDILEDQLLEHPALMPLLFPTDNTSVAEEITKVDAGEAQVLEVLRKNADSKLKRGMKEICSADWVKLMNLPMAKNIAIELGTQISRRPSASDSCPRPEQQYPPELQAKYGQCMPWLLRCMYSKPTSEEVRSFAGHVCMTVSMGFSVAIPPVGLVAGYACGAYSVGAHALNLADRNHAQALSVSCMGANEDCNPERLQEARDAVYKEIKALAFDVALQLGAPFAIENVIGPVLKGGLKITYKAVQPLIARLKALGSAADGKGEVIVAELKEIISDLSGGDREAFLPGEIHPFPPGVRPVRKAASLPSEVMMPQHKTVPPPGGPYRAPPDDTLALAPAAEERPPSMPPPDRNNPTVPPPSRADAPTNPGGRQQAATNPGGRAAAATPVDQSLPTPPDFGIIYRVIKKADGTSEDVFITAEIVVEGPFGKTVKVASFVYAPPRDMSPLEALIQEHGGKSLEFLGKGGMHKVFAHPTYPGKVIKILDADLILENFLKKMSPEEKAKYIPYPGEVTSLATRELLARIAWSQVVLGKVLREDILPTLKTTMQDEVGVEVDMLDVEIIDKLGSKIVPKIEFGNPADIGKVPMVIRGDVYMNYLKQHYPADSPLLKDAEKIESVWNNTWDKANEGMEDMSGHFGVAFKKNGVLGGKVMKNYDVGNRGDLTPVNFTIDATGKIKKFTIGDF